MADELNKIAADMPDIIYLTAEEGSPYSGERIPVELDDEIKNNLAYIMLATGEDFETAVRNTLEEGLANEDLFD